MRPATIRRRHVLTRRWRHRSVVRRWPYVVTRRWRDGSTTRRWQYVLARRWRHRAAVPRRYVLVGRRRSVPSRRLRTVERSWGHVLAHRVTPRRRDRDVGHLTVRRPDRPRTTSPHAPRKWGRDAEHPLKVHARHCVTNELTRGEVRRINEEPVRPVVADKGRRQRRPAGVASTEAPVDPGRPPRGVGHPHPAPGRLAPPTPVVEGRPTERQRAGK